ncbi:hypothetical protein GCM10011405_14930 [Rufibacter glacialis]|nr:hypothetical protein GCM10011405_14930 [Rufibacter glacialis]
MSVRPEPQSNPEIPIFILTNGVHTDLVVPIRNEVADWSSFVQVQDTKGQDQHVNWVAFGWGDKGFYLETPTWADLKASTAFKAATGLSESAIHATFYKSVEENEACKRIMLSRVQYEKLVQFIKSRFDTKADGLPIYIPTNAN